jgi:pimeloyl-ACP methyl ester carboxylesterase
MLAVNGTDLYCERRGAGEPLLLIQGMGGHSLHWGEIFLGLLERDFELVLYDHRGLGRSTPCDGSFTIDDLAGDAAALLDGLGLESAHVLGISMEAWSRRSSRSPSRSACGR